MYYINSTPNETGNYGTPMGQPFTECIKLPDELLADYLAYNGFVNLTTDGDTVTSVEPNTEAWEAWKATLPPEPDPLETAKAERISKSKTDLETYLLNHPLQWTDGEYYAITQDKQNQLTSTLVSAQVDGEPPEWNSTGLVCKQWDVAELAALGCAIKNRVKALVKYQQAKELEIKAAETIDELNAIVIDYDSVSSD